MARKSLLSSACVLAYDSLATCTALASERQLQTAQVAMLIL